MQEQFQIRFCTYFKRIKNFLQRREAYSDYIAFCQKEDSIAYTAGDGSGILIRLLGRAVLHPLL